MGKKFSVMIVAFFTLIAFNFIVALKMIHRHERQVFTKRVLDEIAYIDQKQEAFSFSSAPLVMGAFETETSVKDARSANLKSFFRKHNSPLYDHAEFIVTTSDKYGMDYRLLPAIAMQESNVCKVIPHDSYNCWGWGIYGSTITRFSSYEEAIDTVARGLHKNYINKGLITATMIMEKYTPSSNGSWAHGVNTFLKALE